jgi:NAD(P)H-flavin reductase
LGIIERIKNIIAKIFFGKRPSIEELVLLKAKEVYCLGEGKGIAVVYKVVEAFKDSGSRVIGIIGADTGSSLVLEEEMRRTCDELFIATRDGSYQKQGEVTDILKELLSVIEKSTHTEYPELVFAAGTTQMLNEVSRLTQGCGIKTITRDIGYVQ